MRAEEKAKTQPEVEKDLSRVRFPGLGTSPGRNEKVMAEYVKDTYALLREKAAKPLAAKIGRDDGFPRGPAGRSIVLTHMKASGFSPEQVEQAGDILSAAGIL